MAILQKYYTLFVHKNCLKVYGSDIPEWFFKDISYDKMISLVYIT